MALSIQPVVTQRDLKRFVTFPWRIYRDDPNWVPPLIAGQMDKLTPGRNPFWKHAERALWLATEGGHPVGTIAAIVDHAQNRALGQAIGSFGFFEMRERSRPRRASCWTPRRTGWRPAG